MRSIRLDRFLAGTAMALVLPLAFALTASAQDARPPSAAEIEAGVPVPNTPNLPPLTAKDTTPDPQPAAQKPVEAAAPPAPAAPVADANAGVTDKLRGLTAGKFDRLINGRKQRESVDSFYQAHNYAPLWIANGALNERGKAAIKFLAGVAADGLEPADYPTAAVNAGADADALAEAEIRLTESVLQFARHAQGGRVHYTRISADIEFNLERSAPAEVLAKLADAADVGAALDSFNPQHPGYKALKAKLAELRKGPEEAKPEEVVRVAEGAALRPGMSDSRIVSVRKRLAVTESPDSPLFDDAVVKAVKAFQKAHDIKSDGTLGRNTIRAMNGQRPRAAANPLNAVLATMERWRWLPHNLGNPYVMVNVPDFSLRVVQDAKTLWHTKIVVGKPGLKTPLMSASMKYITVNPTWNVPPSIIRNEYLPVLQRDPTALQRTGLKMEQNRDGTIRIFQPPGDRNALGRIRFNFPNKFLVYQHDTPDKQLFARDPRAYSHGCMRVENPLKYGEVLLSLALPGQGYSQERLRKMFGGSEININFPKPIPVHLSYQTAFVDDAGKLVIRDDVYGWDAAVLSWLRGDQRKVAEIAIDRPKSSSSSPVMMPAGLIAGGGRPEPSFFDRLFGLSPAEAAVDEPRRNTKQRRRVSGGGRSIN